MGEPVLFCSQSWCGLESVVAVSMRVITAPPLISGLRYYRAHRKQNAALPTFPRDLFLNTVRARETICSFYAGAPILNTPRFREETIP